MANFFPFFRIFRKEWENRGQLVLSEMLEKVKQMWPDEEKNKVESAPRVQRRSSVKGNSK